MGDVNELKARAAELQNTDPQLNAFAAEMQRFLKGFQLNTLSAWLELYVEKQEE